MTEDDTRRGGVDVGHALSHRSFNITETRLKELGVDLSQWERELASSIDPQFLQFARAGLNGLATAIINGKGANALRSVLGIQFLSPDGIGVNPRILDIAPKWTGTSGQYGMEISDLTEASNEAIAAAQAATIIEQHGQKSQKPGVERDTTTFTRTMIVPKIHSKDIASKSNLRWPPSDVSLQYEKYRGDTHPRRLMFSARLIHDLLMNRYATIDNPVTNRIELQAGIVKDGGFIFPTHPHAMVSFGNLIKETAAVASRRR